MNRQRVLRLILGSAIAVIAFAAACVAIREILPFPRIHRVQAKIMYFREHGDKYDTLFVGSSRIYHQIIPAQFDELTRAGGAPTKSFNSGIAGMRPPEDSYYFEQLVAAQPKNLRWVFIEVNDIRPRMDWNMRSTDRAQYWHDPARTSLMLRRLTAPRNPGRKRNFAARWRDWTQNFGEVCEHLEFFVREMSNLGKGDFVSERLLTIPNRQLAYKLHLGDDLAGWIETGRGEAVEPSQHDQLVRERAERLLDPAERNSKDAISQENLDRMIALSERLGATAVLIVPPTTKGKIFYPTPERLKKTVLLDFNDPAKFPELYIDAHRLDPDHLNTAGARAFTRLLAEHWLARKDAPKANN